MIELYYDAYSVACFAVSYEMGSRTQMEFFENLYEREYEYLHPAYKGNKRRFIADVLYWTDYLVDKEKLDREFPVVERDFHAAGREFVRENLISEYPEFDLFFMFLRLRILYIEKQKYVRMKLRTLLRSYGYKRRSAAITLHIRDCMMFYHIRSYLRNWEECDLKYVELDDMITFRIC